VLWPFIFATVGLSITLNVVNVGMLGIYPIPDLLHPASAASLADTLAQMDQTSRDNYLMTAILDVVYPLSYGLAFSGLLARLRPRPGRMAWLPWVPLCGCVMDLIENLFFVLLISRSVPATGTWLVPAAAANTFKWVCADFTMVAVASLLVWKAQRGYRAWRRGSGELQAHAGTEG